MLLDLNASEEDTMDKMISIIAKTTEKAFVSCGYDGKYGACSISNRPDLCEYQCNGALMAAKEYHKAPILIAEEVVSALAGMNCFSYAEAVKPGFINLKLDEAFLAEYLRSMQADERFGCGSEPNPHRIIIDYGGPNVAKPLHVGHLRSAIIGESVKRICRYMGNDVIGDIHLGDWGLQMGLIITELKEREPGLPYFIENYAGEYPEEAPFTISELEEIYPAASSRSKEDTAYYEAAMEATKKLQNGDRGCRALWEQIIKVSVSDLKKNYARLHVDFDWWKGESDAQKYIPDMVQRLKDEGFAHYDQGALVVSVKEASDTKEVPPCMILKSNGSSLYNTTDLATLVQRRGDFDPDELIYIVDKRQDLYFTQVFRCAKKTGIVKSDTKLFFLGFGTMNGKDGKPFKTREGGVMRLEDLIHDINTEMYEKIITNDNIPEKEAEHTAEIVGLAAIKYGDLSNQASKDYVFDIERFTSFEGNTGPYLLYTIVRINSIIKKYEEEGADIKAGAIGAAQSEAEKALMLEISKFSDAVEMAYKEIAPNRICAFLYDIANAFNRFYHETKILGETDEARRAGLIRLLVLTEGILTTCIDLLGFEAPERM